MCIRGKRRVRRTDGSGENDHGDLERLVVFTAFSQLADSCERLEASDDKKTLDIVLLEHESYCLQIFTGEATVRTDLGTT